MVTGSPRAIRQPNNSDDPRGVQQHVDLVSGWVREHIVLRGPISLVWRMAAPEYTVLVEPHGRRITVAADRPILESALSAGLNLPHSCKSGHCASCRVQLRIGKVEYPNAFPLGVTAEEAAAGKILLCQARARSDLVVQARLIASVTDVEIKTFPCLIAQMTPLAPDVMQVFLRLP